MSSCHIILIAVDINNIGIISNITADTMSYTYLIITTQSTTIQRIQVGSFRTCCIENNSLAHQLAVSQVMKWSSYKLINSLKCLLENLEYMIIVTLGVISGKQHYLYTFNIWYVSVQIQCAISGIFKNLWSVCWLVCKLFCRRIVQWALHECQSITCSTKYKTISKKSYTP